MKNYLVKIRGGVEVDSAGKKAGKGPLIAEEISNTLGTSQDQYLFQAVGVDRYNQTTTGNVIPTLKTPNGGDDIPCVVTFEPGIASRDGGHVYENVSGTLRATPGDNQMTVAYDIGEARLRNPQEYIEKSPTITARCGTGGNNVPAVVFENHAQDSRYKGPLKVAQPVTATYGMGGNNQPLVVFSKIRRAKTTDDFETWGETGVRNTLNTFDNGDVRTNECVICMATQQGGAEILEDKSPTITAAAGMSGNNQPVICLQGNGIDRADTAGCNGKGWTEDVSYTLNTIDRHAVVYLKTTGTLMATGSYCGQDAYNDMFVVEDRGGYEVISLETFHCTTDDKAQPIKARDYKDPLVICYEKMK